MMKLLSNYTNKLQNNYLKIKGINLSYYNEN